jgi:hypothetical protein
VNGDASGVDAGRVQALADDGLVADEDEVIIGAESIEGGEGAIKDRAGSRPIRMDQNSSLERTCRPGRT